MTKFAKLVTKDDIRKNEYNLNIPRYVDSSDDEEPCYYALLKELLDRHATPSIIGMMNTADRSLAMLDYALRRRFAFFEIKPGFTTDGFREYRMSLENEKFDKLIACVESLNNVISNDESLGDGFCIGHSYFCNLLPDTIDDQVLSGIVEYELIPLLKEYWFDEPTKVKDWSSNLRSAIK